MKSSIELIRLIAVILITFAHTRNSLESGIAYMIFERIPLFGTAILSVISGYLYYEVSRKKKNLFARKIKSLAIPYLIANVSVLSLVIILNKVFGYNALNRLSFDQSLIFEGLLSLNSPPINPPTYFVRDIFVIFCVISLLSQKEYKVFFILIPLILFGTIILRLDVAFLFCLGVLYSWSKHVVSKKYFVLLSIVTTIIVGIVNFEYLKLPLSFLLFVAIIDLKFRFPSTGRYSYMLHLYHSPIIVMSYPIIRPYIHNTYLNLICQILIALSITYLMFRIVNRYKSLLFITGGR